MKQGAAVAFHHRIDGNAGCLACLLEPGDEMHGVGVPPEQHQTVAFGPNATDLQRAWPDDVRTHAVARPPQIDWMSNGERGLLRDHVAGERRMCGEPQGAR